MAKTIEVDGIEVSVTIEPTRDYEIIECETVLADPDATTAARNRAYYRRNHILLGDQYDRVMGELRAAHDGELDISTVRDFITRVVAEVVEAKN